MPTPEKSPQQYLATGFRDVDRSGDTTACTRCLDLLADIPFFHAVKEESFRIIAGTEPALVLDAGCGAGNDLCALAPLLPPSSRIAGLDASAALLSTAAERTALHRDRCFLLRGDLSHIPCRSGVFDACRIDRVLQHIPDPEQAIRELIRVLEPGGTLVAFDNDWDTLSIGVSDTDVSAWLTRFWSDSFASGRIRKGSCRHLPPGRAYRYSRGAKDTHAHRSCSRGKSIRYPGAARPDERGRALQRRGDRGS